MLRCTPSAEAKLRSTRHGARRLVEEGVDLRIAVVEATKDTVAETTKDTAAEASRTPDVEDSADFGFPLLLIYRHCKSCCSCY